MRMNITWYPNIENNWLGSKSKYLNTSCGKQSWRLCDLSYMKPFLIFNGGGLEAHKMRE